ncbi:MAG TPA: hypothetical protein VGL86_31780 [Polyangia bacterium]
MRPNQSRRGGGGRFPRGGAGSRSSKVSGGVCHSSASRAKNSSSTGSKVAGSFELACAAACADSLAGASFFDAGSFFFFGAFCGFG